MDKLRIFLAFRLYVGLIYLCFVVPGSEAQRSQAEIISITETLMFSNSPSKGDGFPETMNLNFNMGQGRMNLTLQRNHNINGSLPVYLGKSGQITSWKELPIQPQFAAYYNLDQQVSLIAVSLAANTGSNMMGMCGSFMKDSKFYAMEPAPEVTSSSRRRRRRRSIEKVKHKVWPEEAMPDDMHYFDYKMEINNIQAMNYQYQGDLRNPFRMERQRGGVHDSQLPTIGDIEVISSTKTTPRQVKYTLELAILADYDLYQSWLDKSDSLTDEARSEEAISRMLFYYMHVANGVDMTFRKIQDADLQIAIKPTSLYIAMEPDMAPWVQNHKMSGSSPAWSVNSDTALTSLQDWLELNKNELPPFDQATVFTKNNLISPFGRNVLGLGVTLSICTKYSVAINTDNDQYSTIQSTAHQIGHNLGAYHDVRENACPQGHIMGAKRGYTFSQCSVGEFRSFMQWLSGREENCILSESQQERTEETEGHTDEEEQRGRPHETLPGQMYTPDEQCERMHGKGSFYCGSIDRDAVICQEMSCWVPDRNMCYKTPDQRASDGTTCGNHKWCMKGKCTYNEFAPNAPDECVYGDYKGRYQDGRTCKQVVGETPWRCYESPYNKECCYSCDQHYNPHLPDCEFGDKAERCRYIKRRECYDRSTAELCCETCRGQHRDIPGCEFGDREAWCPDEIQHPRDCYDYNTSCCATCRNYETPLQNCMYGDKANWCERMKPRACYNDNTTCCKSCLNLRKDHQPGCEYGDKSDWCSRVKSNECYDYSDTCCESCERHKTGVPGCIYGDRMPSCSKADCSTEEGYKLCCATCTGHVTSHPPTTRSSTTSTPTTTSTMAVPTTTTKISRTTSTPTTIISDTSTTTSTGRTTTRPTTASRTTDSTTTSTTPTISVTTTMASTLASLTSTKRAITKPPSVCPQGDKASWCKTMPIQDCYVSDNTCCETCPKYHTGVPGCEYGDYFSWCKGLSPESCKQNAIVCCVTCAHQNERSLMSVSSPPPEQQPTLVPYTGCSGEDRAKWCININAWDCYVSDNTCCSSCKRFHNGVKGCVYGDKMSWCKNVVREARDCRPANIRDNCCDTCKQYTSENIASSTTTTMSTTTTRTTTTTTTPSTTTTSTANQHDTPEFYRNCDRDKSSAYCADVRRRPHYCYNDKDYCCQSCMNLYTGVEGCDFGDRVSWCDRHINHGSNCYAHDHAYQCCLTCAPFYTGIPGCEFGDRKKDCTPSDCDTMTGRTECCHTCAPTTVTPLPDKDQTSLKLIGGGEDCRGDTQAYCDGLDPSFCYNRETYEQCCTTCSQYQARGKPGCEFGDKRTWCSDILLEQCPNYRNECCSTCS